MPSIEIRYFSIVRDAVGKEREELEVEEGATIQDLLKCLEEKYPKLRKFLKHEGYLIVLVNGRASKGSRILSTGDEVALLPPVSGGSIYRGSIVDRVDSLNLAREVIASVEPSVGAVMVFTGIVKGEVGGVRVNTLKYEVYEPYASEALQRIAEDVGRRYGLKALIIEHCKGVKKPGEQTLAVVVAAKGRNEAFKGLLEAVERVKTEPPIFKLESREDGEYWVIGERRVKRGEVFEKSTLTA